MSAFLSYSARSGSSGVTSLDGMTGAITLVAGSGISIVDGVGTITIASTGGGDVTLTPVGSSPNANGASLSGQALTLQPADATNPGVLTAIAQSIGGVKIFSSAINADGGMDVTATGGTDTLGIGNTNADVINIGRSGITINMIGSTINQTVTNLNVTDKNITINSGGGVGSGSVSGIQVEEASAITGYVETSGDRNSWVLLAPNTAGIATITPGASGFTIDQGSHNPVTLGTANGLSLSTQVLSLALSSTSTTGALSSADWNTFNGKQASGSYITALTGDVTAAGPGSAAATLATVNSNIGSFGTASNVSTITVNAKGLVTAASNTAIQIAESQVTNLVSDLAGKQPTGNYITALTGDATAAGPGSSALTLATVNSNVGSFTNASITVNAKGLITAASSGTAGANTALSNLASTAVNVSIYPGVNNSIDLGGSNSGSKNWNNIWGAQLHASTLRSITNGNINIDFENGLLYNSSGSAILDYHATNVALSNSISLGTGVTASTVPYLDASKLIVSSAVTPTELGYVSGVTSAIQTQLNTKITNPMTTGGDLIYGGASGVPTRLANGSSTQFLKSSGGTAAPTWAAISSVYTAPLVTSYLSGSGTHTFTGSPLYVIVECVGGGGGGEGSGSASSGGNGGNGGNTTFGTSLIVANGGAGGALASTGGAGGSASLGSGPLGRAISGGSGSARQDQLVTQNVAGGPGGNSALGGGGGSGVVGAGQAGTTNSGGGGGGAGMGSGVSGATGSGGGAGGCVRASISGSTLSGLSGSAAYAVGAAGTAGAAGTSGFAGGAGGSGIIVVTEYYQ